jgi:hypothetical protein
MEVPFHSPADEPDNRALRRKPGEALLPGI